MANITPTTNAVFIPEVWSGETLKATEQNLVMAKRVARYDDLVKGMGDTVHIPNVANLTAANKTAGTALTPAANTETENTISIDKHKAVAFLIEDITRIQSKPQLQSIYTDKAGYAIAEAVDDDLVALYAGLSTSVGTASTALTDAVTVSAVVALDDANAPQSDRHFVIKPATKGDILKLDKFVLHTNTGPSADGGRVLTGKLGEIYGIEVAVSTNIVVSTGTRNLMFHREAFALAMQKQPSVKADYNVLAVGTEVVVDSIYGVAELRDAFGVEVLT